MHPESDSDLRSYLLVLGGVLGALLVLLASFTAAGYGLGIVDSGNAEIYAYQLRKIQHLGKPDIVFVGDSSLGNAIDAVLFTELSGLATANLALTGSYGSGGALNMIRRVLAKGESPRAVVIMQSIATMTKDRALTGYFFSAPLISKLTLPPDKLLEIYLNINAARQILRQLESKGLNWPSPAIANDYLKQRRRQPATIIEHAKPLLPEMIADSQFEYLVKIDSLCRHSGIVCIYAHGPIFERYCQQARAYIESLDARIRTAGLQVLPGTPVCLKPDEIGDSLDHVRPDLKQIYTRRYFELFGEKIAQIARDSGQSLTATARMQ